MSVLLPLTVILFIVLVMVSVGAPGADLSILFTFNVADPTSSLALLFHNLPSIVPFAVNVTAELYAVQLPLSFLYCSTYPLGIVPDQLNVTVTF